MNVKLLKIFRNKYKYRFEGSFIYVLSLKTGVEFKFYPFERDYILDLLHSELYKHNVWMEYKDRRTEREVKRKLKQYEK